MTLFQFLILIIIIVVVIKAVIRLLHKEMSSWLFILWLFFWGAVGVINFFPELLSWAAFVLGVGRGVDLLIYLGIVLLFYIVFIYNLRLQRYEKKLSRVVQQVAIEKAFKQVESKENEE